MRAAAATVLAFAVAALVVPGARADPPLVPGQRAGEHVGEEVAVEGRVVGTYVSPLATVLAFAPNFAGFTATILAADRAKFPPDIAERARDRMVRVTGVVAAYRGKPEMTLHEPSQLTVLTSADSKSVPPDAPAVSPAPAAASGLDDVRRALSRIEQRLDALDARLMSLEQGGAAATVPEEQRVPGRTRLR